MDQFIKYIVLEKLMRRKYWMFKWKILLSESIVHAIIMWWNRHIDVAISHEAICVWIYCVGLWSIQIDWRDNFPGDHIIMNSLFYMAINHRMLQVRGAVWHTFAIKFFDNTRNVLNTDKHIERFKVNLNNQPWKVVKVITHALAVCAEQFNLSIRH